MLAIFLYPLRAFQLAKSQARGLSDGPRVLGSGSGDSAACSHVLGLLIDAFLFLDLFGVEFLGELLIVLVDLLESRFPILLGQLGVRVLCLERIKTRSEQAQSQRLVRSFDGG